MKNSNEDELDKTYVYVPEGAKLNIENKTLLPPEVQYEKRKLTIDENVTKKLCGDKYGKRNN